MASNTCNKTKRRHRFYPVAVGHTQGIFLQWSMCSKSTNSYPSNCFELSPDFDSAVRFMTARGFKVEDIQVHINNSSSVSVEEYRESLVTTQHSQSHSIPVGIPQCTPSLEQQEFNDEDITSIKRLVASEHHIINPDQRDEEVIHSDHREEETNSTLHDSLCPFCNEEDTEFMISCADCKSWVHYRCTQLPTYQLSVFYKSQRKFSCKNCVTVNMDIAKHITEDSSPSREFRSGYTQTPHIEMKEAGTQTQTPENQKSNTPTTTTTTTTSFHSFLHETLREFEAKWIDKIQEERTDLKFRLYEKDIELMTKEKNLVEAENAKLKKEINKMKTELENTKKEDSKTTLTEKMHKLRMDMEQGARERLQKWKAEKNEMLTKMDSLQQSIGSRVLTNERSEVLAKEKDEEILRIKQECENLKQTLKVARDDLYEARRTSVVCMHDHVRETPQPPANDSLIGEIDRWVIPESPNTQSPVQADIFQTPLVPETQLSSQERISPARRLYSDVVNAHTVSTTPPQQIQSVLINRKEEEERKKPKVAIIGNSQIKPIIPQRLVPSTETSKILAYTAPEAANKLFKTNRPQADCIVIHEITNDVGEESTIQCADRLHAMGEDYAKLHPQSQVIISLGTPRLDSRQKNEDTKIINALIRAKVETSNISNLHYCDNQNFTRYGNTQRHLLAYDGVHLSRNGTKLLASNLRKKIECVLKLDRRVNRSLQ